MKTVRSFGTSERNGFEGPGFANLDFSLVRFFHIRESVTSSLVSVEF